MPQECPVLPLFPFRNEGVLGPPRAVVTSRDAPGHRPDARSLLCAAFVRCMRSMPAVLATASYCRVHRVTHPLRGERRSMHFRPLHSVRLHGFERAERHFGRFHSRGFRQKFWVAPFEPLALHTQLASYHHRYRLATANISHQRLLRSIPWPKHFCSNPGLGKCPSGIPAFPLRTVGSPRSGVRRHRCVRGLCLPRSLHRALRGARFEPRARHVQLSSRHCELRHAEPRGHCIRGIPRSSTG